MSQVEEVAAEIELLFQKYDRLRSAKQIRSLVDAGSLDYPDVDKAYRHARDNFTAAKFVLAERIAGEGRDGNL